VVGIAFLFTGLTLALTVIIGTVLPSGVRARVAVEAGTKLGWEHD